MTHPRDENTLVIPKHRHRELLPRRGGTEVRMAPPSTTRIRDYHHQLDGGRVGVEKILSHPRTLAAHRDAANRYLAGEPDPLGAAVVTRVLSRITLLNEPPTDAWVSDHGVGFAAEALPELAGITVTADSGDCTDECRHGWITEHLEHFRVTDEAHPGSHDSWFYGIGPEPLRLVRGWLAAMPESAYRDVVAALAKQRHNPAKRLMVAFLAPTEREWVDECCREAGTHGSGDARQLLWCALGSAEQLRLLGEEGSLDRRRWGDNRAHVLVTVLDGLGLASVPVLTPILDWYGDLPERRSRAELVSLLPSDTALTAMAAGLGTDKVVTAAFSAAASRFPLRTARVLAAVAAGETETCEDAVSNARALLAARLRTEPDLATDIAARLGPAAAAVVAELAPDAEADDHVDETELPSVLIAPPWAKTGRAKPITVADLAVSDQTLLVWEPGERDRWRDLPTYESTMTGPWDQRVRQYRGNELWAVRALRLLDAGPEESVRPLLAEWHLDADGFQAEVWARRVVARFGLDAYPVALSVARSRPSDCGPVLLPFRDVEVATLMAAWLAAKTRARRHAVAWFARHGRAAVALLLPAAVGTDATARRNAEAALRYLARELGAETVQAVAAQHGDEVATAVAALSLTDPLAQLPARIPKPGTWAAPAALPPLRRRGDARRLPDLAVSHVLTMLAMSANTEHYAGWELLRDLCDPDSLRRFCWAVFELWRSAGEPGSDGWALRQLGVFGDDATVAALLPVIMDWRSRQEYKSSNAGLDVLTLIGTETALDELYRVHAKAGRMSFRRQAEAKLVEVAVDRGQDPSRLLEHLECRAIPDLGLDAAATMRLDYGPRGFTVGFDEHLTMYIVDDEGRRIEKLPRAVKTDDRELAKAATKTLRKLRKDVDAFGSTHLTWLEAAMREHRLFTADDFFALFTRHPLLSRLARRLLWVCRHETDTAFRIAEDGGFATVDEEEFTPPQEAEYLLAHPIELADDLDAWREIFDDYELVQPFQQLNRYRHELTEAERDSTVLDRFDGRIIGQRAREVLAVHGWDYRFRQGSTGSRDLLSRQVGAFRSVHVDLVEVGGAAPGDGEHRMRIGSVRISASHAAHDAGGDDDAQVNFGNLNAAVLSDLLHDLGQLTAPPDSATD